MLRVAEDSFFRTDVGRQRQSNEDAMFARAPLFVIADGMGGAQAGEVASRIAVETFEPGLPDSGPPEEQLATVAREANRRIYERARADRRHEGMGTTLTAALAGDGEVAFAHVGDSRAYLWRDGSLQRLTRDHSLVEEYVRRGAMTEEEAAGHPQRSIITRALGPEQDVDVDTFTQPARAGDVYLLCSDGLTSMVAEARIAEVLAGAGTLRTAGQQLLDEANANGGRDNITIVLFRLEQVGAGQADGPPPVSDDTQVAGPGAATTAQVREALATTPPPVPRRTAPLPPSRTPAPKPKPARRRPRWLVASLTVATIVALLVAGGWLASRQVYFIGTDSQGFVTIYRGLPYDLPAGIHLYQPVYDSAVAAAYLSPAERHKLLNHKWRSRGDAANLVDDLETGKLAK